MRKKVALVSLLSLLAASCVTKSDVYSHKRKEPPKLIWLSLDGLQFDVIQARSEKLKSPHPKGFQFLLEQKNVNRKLIVETPTITAPSHISTITCSAASEHGIFSNYTWTGSKFESGFSAAFKQETFVHALRQKGVFVASYGYPSIDGSNENRNADVGATYFNPKNKGQVITLPWGANEIFKVQLTDGTLVDVTLMVSPDGSEVTLKNEQQTHTLKELEIHDLFFKTPEGLNLTAVMLMRSQDRKSEIYFSPTSQNAAFPRSFKERLENQNIVFSPGKDYMLRDYSENIFIKTVEHRLQHFTDAMRFVLEIEKPEAFFFYFEDLDVLGHQYTGQERTEELAQNHFEKIDDALGALLEKADKSTNIVILGDHGMTEIVMEINANLLFPQKHLANMHVVNSGGSLFFYGKDKALNSMPQVMEPWFQETVQALKEADDPTKNVGKLFERVVVKGTVEAKELGLHGENSPWIVAIAKNSFRLKQSTDKNLILAKKKDVIVSPRAKKRFKDALSNLDTLEEPKVPGDHGFLNISDEMRTSLFFIGPELDKISATSVQKNTQVVPAVADALSWPRPNGCAN